MLSKREAEQSWKYNFQDFTESTAKCVQCERVVSYGDDISPLLTHTLFYHTPSKRNTLVWLYFDKIGAVRARCKDCGRYFLRSERPRRKYVEILKMHLIAEHHINNHDVSWVHQCYKFERSEKTIECCLCHEIWTEDFMKSHLLETHYNEIPAEVRENGETQRNWTWKHFVTKERHYVKCTVCGKRYWGKWFRMKKHYRDCEKVQGQKCKLITSTKEDRSVNSEEIVPEVIMDRLNKMYRTEPGRLKDSYEDTEDSYDDTEDSYSTDATDETLNKSVVEEKVMPEEISERDQIQNRPVPLIDVEVATTSNSLWE